LYFPLAGPTRYGINGVWPEVRSRARVDDDSRGSQMEPIWPT
jgi:hypothetical protein